MIAVRRPGRTLRTVADIAEKIGVCPRMLSAALLQRDAAPAPVHCACLGPRNRPTRFYDQEAVIVWWRANESADPGAAMRERYNERRRRYRARKRAEKNEAPKRHQGDQE